jgi:RHS repeat-associated protein
VLAAAGLLSALLGTVPLLVAAADKPNGDVFDQFFRYTETENRVFFQDLPDEKVDPFSGTLHIVRKDLVLPGKAGLDLQIVRSYSSKIWGRADLLEMEPLLAEKERSVLGYGWNFHMGRLKNPNASGNSGFCSGDFPIYESPDGGTRVFYPAIENIDPGTNRTFVSQDHWRMRMDCEYAESQQGVCLWSDQGVRYEFSGPGINGFYVGMLFVMPLTRIVDPFGNAISVTYIPQTGAVNTVTDTYGRTIDFRYITGEDGRRLRTMSFNNKTYQYDYQTFGPAQTGGAGRVPLPGQKRFLSQVTPPAGPPEMYEYAPFVSVEQNQYALSKVTYPSGGTTSYLYDKADFFTGRDVVPFPVVTHRTVAGRGLPVGEWAYSYVSPIPTSPNPPYGVDRKQWAEQWMNVTTISRPDGKHDVYRIAGFGYVLARNTGEEEVTYGVGLTRQISRADGAEIEEFGWMPDKAHKISEAYYSPPSYSDYCTTDNLSEIGVAPPIMTGRVLYRDGAFYETSYSDYDEYGQAHTVVETGYQGVFRVDPSVAAPRRVRTTRWTFLAVPELNIVRGRPLTQHVCVGTNCVDSEGRAVTQSGCASGDCVDNAWTYDPQRHYARDTETLSGVRTSFGVDSDGNLARVTNALGQSLQLSEYVEGYGTPRRVKFNEAFSVIRTTSWEGWILTETNGRGYTTTYDHDPIGRIRTLTPPNPDMNEQTVYTYAADNSKVTTVRGTYFRNSYLDGLGRETSAEDSEGVLTSVRYDAMGRAWFKSYPYEAALSETGEKYDFDGLGRVTTQTRAHRPVPSDSCKTPGGCVCETPGACVTTYTFQSNCTSAKLERGENDSTVTSQCNISYGDPGESLLGQAVAGDWGLWEYAYNAAGKLTQVTAPLPQGNRGYEYDANQFLHREVTPEGGTKAYEPNAIGQIKRKTDARPVTATYDYSDPLSRLKAISYSNDTENNVTRDYDNANNVTLVSSPNGGRYDYVYDELNRVTSQKWSYGGKVYETTFHYDPHGCMYSETLPTGTVLTMTCDTVNRIKTIKMGEGDDPKNVIVKDVLYHPSGQVKSMVYGNLQATTMDYDDRGRTKTITTSGVIDLSYVYDGADNVKTFENKVLPNSSKAMIYDQADRLQSVDAPGLWGSLSYDYDVLGNRTAQYGAPGGAYNYDWTSNRLNTATDYGQASKSMTFTWDAAGRLAASSDGASYRYDGNDRRIQKVEARQTTLYHYDPSGRLVAETLPDGTKLRDYVYLGNKLIAVDGCMEAIASSSCTERQWYHTDTLGSPLARTDGSGAVVERFEYKPWGERWRSSGEPGDRWYNGRVYDSGTGFQDYGARMYWPAIGRFVSADSYLGDSASPASLNRYGYVQNNPYRYTDPTGHYVESPLDIALMVFDVASWVYHASTGDRDAANIDMLALAADTACLAAPLATGGGLAVRAGEYASTKVLLHAGSEEATRGIAHAEQLTSSAARREAMREQGIPTSQQPRSQSQNASGRAYEYEVGAPGGGTQTMSVQQQTLDRSHPGQAHWEAGKVKTDPRTGQTRTSTHGRPKLTNDKSKVNY